MLFSTTNERVQSGMTDVNPVADLVGGIVSRLSRFWFSFFFLGIVVHCVFHGHHINHFSKCVAVEKSHGSRSHRD